MKKWILGLAMLFMTGLCWSQSLQPMVIASGSGSGMGNTQYLDYTIGQVAYLTASSASNHLTQGFQQPAEISTPVVDLRPDWTINVFPNPASETIFLSADQIPAFSKARYDLIDLQGRILLHGLIQGQLQEIDVNHLPASMYFLRISDETGISTTIKLHIQ